MHTAREKVSYKEVGMHQLLAAIHLLQDAGTDEIKIALIHQALQKAVKGDVSLPDLSRTRYEAQSKGYITIRGYDHRITKLGKKFMEAGADQVDSATKEVLAT